jgi:hypothetical protein
MEFTRSSSADGFAELGFEIVPSVLADEECASVAESFDRDRGRVSERDVLALGWCSSLARRIRTNDLLARMIPSDAIAVQCTAFEKSAASNWLVPVHQDLSIPVADHVPSPELTGWSTKAGSLFVQPPAEVLARLLAVRVHLDPCTLDDGPLRVVPGSHVRGRIAATIATELRAEQQVSCAVGTGGAMVMKPLLLHSSSKARGSSRRRVLHFVFGPPELPFGLRWRATN